MKKMGKYCKAYEIKKLMEFPAWAGKLANIEAQVSGDGDIAKEPASRDFYYLQENFTVTDGIFLDESVVFDAVTPEWVEFCRDTLKFEVLNYETK